MKITLCEVEGCFALELTAETMIDAALLVRFGVNATREIRSCATHAHRDGVFTGYVVFGKHYRADSAVPKRK